MRVTLFKRIFLLSLAWTTVSAQGSFTVAFWNVENLFDTTNAALVQDDDFTPAGRYAWTEERLAIKISHLTKVISDIPGDPALFGLAEIENRPVLDRLVTQGLKDRYQIIHKESPDERGIDCALLYDPQQVKLRDQRFHTVYLGGEEKTRDIIEATFSRPGDQSTLTVFVNHWPSRWGGQLETEPLRKQAAFTLRNRIDVLLKRDPNTDIIILGDFNDYPPDASLVEVLRAHALSDANYPGDLINTTWELHHSGTAGTYMYRGNWGVLDQIIISRGLLNPLGYSWVTNSTRAFAPDYLIEKEGPNAGWPFRLYRSGKYQAGYSDHLPIYCELKD